MISSAEPNTASDRNDPEGLIFDLQRYSLHDGPGLRVLVFFKGCPLRCLWCSNPESQSATPEVMLDETRCRQCGDCASACRPGAIRRGPSGWITYDRGQCTFCGSCVEACPHKARKWVGRRVSVSGLLKEIARDMPFFRRSGGGVTLGGGEPLFQPDFAHALLKACREQNIHTSVETCGAVDWPHLERLAPWTDLFLYDLKQMDLRRHRWLTGRDNRQVLANLERLAGIHSQIIVRYPFIPGLNDSEEDMLALIRFLRQVGNVTKVEWSPYHRYGEFKYGLLGRKYALEGIKTPSAEGLAMANDLLRSHGFQSESLL
jgi:pyruvate formate lyase activating enzyme